MSDSRHGSHDESAPRSMVFINDWSGTVQTRLVFYPPEIKQNHTLNIAIGPDGTIVREEDMEIL